MEVGIDSAERELGSRGRIVGEARSGTEVVHSGIVVDGHSGLGEEGHFDIVWEAQFEIVVAHFGPAVGHFESEGVDRSGIGVEVHSESLVEAHSGNWEEDRSGMEVGILVQGVVGIAVAVGNLGRFGKEEVQAD